MFKTNTDILNIRRDYQFFSLYLNFMLHTMLDVTGVLNAHSHQARRRARLRPSTRASVDVLDLAIDQHGVIGRRRPSTDVKRAWCEWAIKVHYKSIKCDVLFSQDSVRTIFR